MDPASALGVAGSIVSIIDVSTKCISTLRRLQQRWKAADITTNLLISQLVTLRAALDQIAAWSNSSLADNPKHHQLVIDLDASLDCCSMLVSSIGAYLDTLDWNDEGSLTFESRARSLLKDATVKDCLSNLSNQANALNLLLTALSCRSISEQKTLLEERKTREVMDRVRDNSSSLRAIYDASSCRSIRTGTTESSSKLSIVFSFDKEILQTKVYQGAMKSFIRRAIGSKDRQRSNMPITTSQSKLEIREQTIRSEEIECQLRKDQLSQRNIIHILATGTDLTGRNALWSMFGLVTDPDTLGDEMAKCRRHIQNHMVRCTQEALHELGRQSVVSSHHLGHVASVVHYELEEGEEILPSLKRTLSVLWEDQPIRRQLGDNRSDDLTLHCLAHYDTILSSSYAPSYRDLIRFSPNRHGRSHALRERAFVIGELTYVFVDYNSREEGRFFRRMDQFEKCQSLIFMVDISEYDDLLPEYMTVNKLHSSLTEFDAVIHSHHLLSKPVILLLNGISRFKEKLPVSPISRFFPDCDAGSDYGAACDYVLNRFVSLNNSQSRQVYAHFMNSDDTNLVRFINAAINDIIISANLKRHNSEPLVTT